MELKTKELRKIINVVKPGLAEKQLVPGMTRLIFTGSNITTYNGQQCIHYPLQTNFECSVNAKEFIKTIDQIKQDEMDIFIDSNLLHVKAGRIYSKFSIDADIRVVTDTIDAILAEMEQGSEKDEWSTVPEEFTKAVLNIAFAASTDKTKQTQCCIHTKDGYALAADIHLGKMGFHYLDQEMPEFMINAKDALSIVNSKVTMLLISKAWVHFASDDNVIFSIRKLEGVFPYAGVFDYLEDRSENTVTITMPADVAEAIETAGIFSDNDDFPIHVTVHGRSMIFEARSAMGEGAYETIIDYDGGDFDFRINSTLMKYMLGVTKDMDIDLEKQKAFFNAGNFWYVMPVKTKKDKE